MKGSVLIVAGRYPCLSETFVQREVEGLAWQGLEVSVLSLRQGDSCSTAGAIQYVYSGFPILVGLLREVFRHPWRCLQTLAVSARDAVCPGEATSLGQRIKLIPQAIAAISAAAGLRGRELRHIHCHFAHAPTTVGMYLATHLGVPFSFVGHANDLFQRRSLLTRKLQRAIFVSCISEWHRQLYLDACIEGAGKYQVIRCGVDLRSWPYRVPLEGNTLRVLSVGRLVEKKGMDTLIRAVALLRPKEHNLVAQVVIAGDGPMRDRLEALAIAEGVSDLVQFLGACSHDQVRALMQDADVLALPCREDSNGDKDGIPVVLMEAMAAGVPVIAGDLPAIRELVHHGITGLMVRDPQGADTVDCLALLAGDSELRGRLSKAAAAHVEAEFSMDVNIARLVSAIESASLKESVKCTAAVTA